MKLSRHILLFLISTIVLSVFNLSMAQPGFKVDIKKPKPYEERLLKAEKTGDGKLKTTKRLLQNLTTRYNYYFNANNKFNEVIARAKEQYKDDFSQLLSFYNYDLNATAADSTQLDSIVYKVRTGILNHDLRNEWIDELYLLWGASWYLQQKFDSASLMFQYINYAYAPQDEDGYYKFIGTHTEGAKELSIVTKEDKKFLHSNTFSRNNAFIWQIRTQVEMGNFASSGSLLNALKRDPAFPKRLENDLQEAEAYWFYKQQRWDSAAKYLLAAIDGADGKIEKARWYYLAAQLMEKAGHDGQATEYYQKSIALTPDPVMEVYGRLNVVRLGKEGGDNAIDKNVAELLKMAKKDKYEDYRDIIYYMAAQMEMQRNNIAAANELLMKGAKYDNGNLASKNKAFLQIADVSYDQKKYLQAGAFYDSIQVNELKVTEAFRVNERKPYLQKITFNTAVIDRQDSLQKIAAMPQADRDAFINQLVKKIRRQQGIKDDVVTSGGIAPITNTNAPVDLFGTQQKGEWYFYNSNSKAKGAAQFKQVWGNRPNVDNWRRFAAINQQLQPQSVMDTKEPGEPTDAPTSGGEISFDALLLNLPYSPEAIKISNDSISAALMNLGTTFMNDVEDYDAAIEAFEALRQRFPQAEKMDEVLFNLYYAYTKKGNASAAAQIKKLLQDKFPASRFTGIASTGKDPSAKTKGSPEATRDYEQVYNLFIEGRFEEAQAAKRVADSVYQTNFWQPQLLYIEAVYHIRQREDSQAKKMLLTIISQNTSKALTDKAQNLINVLNRRSEIENELTQLQITRPPEDSTVTTPTDIVRNLPVAVDTIAKKQPAIALPKDTTATRQKDVSVSKPTDTVATKVVVTKVKDSVAKKDVVVKAKDSVAKKPLTTKAKDSVGKKDVVVKTKDSVAKKPLVTKAKDSVVTQPKITTVTKTPAKKVSDSIAKKAVVQPVNSVYSFQPDAPHYVLILLEKVDPIFVGEAKNAFFRFNKEKFYTTSLDVQIQTLTPDLKMLVITSFTSAQLATEYALRAKSLAPSEIIPWLTGNKYTFSIISATNLETLKSNTDVAGYKKFLAQHLPGKF